jgi:hypothetical protein
MAGVVHVAWYATVFRGDMFAEAVTDVTPLALRHGATKYQVQRSRDDRYKILQMIWFEDKGDWYRFWESAEMIEFRARYLGKYQIPIVYVWHDELCSGELGPPVVLAEEPAPAPEPVPTAAS